MSGFTVAGSLDDTLYEVQVTGDPARPVAGSKRVAALCEQYEGRTVLATPTGPAYKVTGGDPQSVLALLSTHTRVRHVSDDAPALVDPAEPGVIH